MSFRFRNPAKVGALQAAGFTGRRASWFPAGACPCCIYVAEPWRKPRQGWVFPPPKGVTNSAHDRAIKRALKAAGF